MKITDKYLLGRFLKILFLALIAFILVVIIVDVVENVDKFIDHDVPLQVVILYYVYYVPFIIMLALPVAVLLSIMFTVGSLAKYHELEVMKANGISLYRLSLPLLAAGFLISVAAIFFTDFVMVPAGQLKDELKTQEIDKTGSRDGIFRQNVIKAARGGWVVFAQSYNELERTGNSVIIDRIENNQITVAIKAKKMIWADSGWVLIELTRRDFHDGDQVRFAAYDTLFAGFLPHTPEIMSRRLKKPRDTRFFDLMKVVSLKQWMGQDTARDKVELYLKISFPFINFIIVILGVPLAANPRRSGGSVGFGLSIIISFIYFVILRAGQSFGYNHKIPPLLAATAGNVIFLLIGSIMFVKARK